MSNANAPMIIFFILLLLVVTHHHHLPAHATLHTTTTTTITIPTEPRCYRRDYHGHHESFCILTLCRGPLQHIWMIPSSEYDLLSKHGEGVHMERIWNIGSVQIVDDSKLPPVHHKSNQVVLINNANHGSAHLAMFFAFPAISFVNSFDLEIIGIRH